MVSHVRSLWRNLVHRRRVERDLDDEVRGAFDLLVEEKVHAGMSAAAARRAATIELGRVESIKAQVQEARAGAFVETLLQDVRYGVRLLARTPLFTIFAAASLALGIGATSAIFSLFDGLVLRKLPVPEPDRLVVLSFGPAGGNFNYSLPYPHFDQIRARNTTLAGVFAINPFGRVTVGHRGQAETADGTYVTGDYYRTLGLAPSDRAVARPRRRPARAERCRSQSCVLAATLRWPPGRRRCDRRPQHDSFHDRRCGTCRVLWNRSRTSVRHRGADARDRGAERGKAALERGVRHLDLHHGPAQTGRVPRRGGARIESDLRASGDRGRARSESGAARARASAQARGRSEGQQQRLAGPLRAVVDAVARWYWERCCCWRA